MTFQHPRRRAVFALLLSPLSLLLANAAWSAEAWSAEDRAVQRALYVQARELQSESQTQSPEYQSLLEQLDGYPLLPYLDDTPHHQRKSRGLFGQGISHRGLKPSPRRYAVP